MLLLLLFVAFAVRWGADCANQANGEDILCSMGASGTAVRVEIIS